MAYAPGIEYRGDQHLFQGIAGAGASVGQGISGMLKQREERKEKAKQEGQLAQSLRRTLAILDPENKSQFDTMGLADLMGESQGRAVRAQQEQQQQQQQLNTARIDQIRQAILGQAAGMENARTERGSFSAAMGEFTDEPEPGGFSDTLGIRPNLEDRTLKALRTPGLTAQGVNSLAVMLHYLGQTAAQQQGNGPRPDATPAFFDVPMRDRPVGERSVRGVFSPRTGEYSVVPDRPEDADDAKKFGLFVEGAKIMRDLRNQRVTQAFAPSRETAEQRKEREAGLKSLDDDLKFLEAELKGLRAKPAGKAPKAGTGASSTGGKRLVFNPDTGELEEEK